ncbi:MAG: SIMPL domain-containing protein [Gammaproteobacteria bacterium]
MMTSTGNPIHLRAAAAILGVAVAAGLAAAGWQLASALLAIQAAQRVVTVKGLAQRDVPADEGVWPIAFTARADDLKSLQTMVDTSFERILAFLGEHGLSGGRASRSVPRITDLEAQPAARGSPPDHRFLAEATLVLRTGDIAGMKAAMENAGALVSQGVVLVPGYQVRPQYLFSGLESIKPDMIAEATRDARRAATRFAADSGSLVGQIRTARQGYFSVQDLDPFTPERKRIRVVTTVEYFLVDESR